MATLNPSPIVTVLLPHLHESIIPYHGSSSEKSKRIALALVALTGLQKVAFLGEHCAKEVEAGWPGIWAWMQFLFENCSLNSSSVQSIAYTFSRLCRHAPLLRLITSHSGTVELAVRLWEFDDPHKKEISATWVPLWSCLLIREPMDLEAVSKVVFRVARAAKPNGQAFANLLITRLEDATAGLIDVEALIMLVGIWRTVVLAFTPITRILLAVKSFPRLTRIVCKITPHLIETSNDRLEMSASLALAVLCQTLHNYGGIPAIAMSIQNGLLVALVECSPLFTAGGDTWLRISHFLNTMLPQYLTYRSVITAAAQSLETLEDSDAERRLLANDVARETWISFRALVAQRFALSLEHISSAVGCDGCMVRKHVYKYPDIFK